jgi:hypothetical protein
LKGASYDQDTTFPKGFKPRRHQMVNSDTWYKLAFKQLVHGVAALFQAKGEQGQLSH